MTDPVPLTEEEERALRSRVLRYGGAQRRDIDRLIATLDRERADANDALTAARLALTRADRDRSTPPVEHEPTPVQYDAGCIEHGGRTDLHCATCGHPLDRSTDLRRFGPRTRYDLSTMPDRPTPAPEPRD